MTITNETLLFECDENNGNYLTSIELSYNRENKITSAKYVCSNGKKDYIHNNNYRGINDLFFSNKYGLSNINISNINTEIKNAQCKTKMKGAITKRNNKESIIDSIEFICSKNTNAYISKFGKSEKIPIDKSIGMILLVLFIIFIIYIFSLSNKKV